MSPYRISLLFILFWACRPSPAFAQEDVEALLNKAQALAEESQRLSEQSRILAEEAKSLIEKAKSLAAEPSSEEIQESPPMEPEGEVKPPPLIQPEVQKAIEQQEARKEAERVRQELAVRGVLLPPGHLEIEPSFTYVNFSNNNLSIDGFALLPIFVVGQIQSERVRRNVLVESLAVSYGLVDGIQMEAEAPFRYRSDEITYSDNRQNEAKKFDVGDLRLGTSLELHHEQGGFLPDVIGSLQVYFPTGNAPFDYDPANPRDEDIPLGSGLWSIQSGLTVIKVSDPVILFGGGNFLYSLSQDVDGRVIHGHVDPGASVGYVLGVAYALNYQFTLNLQIQQTFTLKTELDDVALNNSSLNDARFTVGGSWALGKEKSLHVAVGTGLTEDAPDLMIRISLPFEFVLKD